MNNYPASMPWLIVRVCGQTYALPSFDVRELVNNPPLTSVPDAPDFVAGVANLRGHILPVIDLRKRLGLVSAAEEADRFLTLMEERRTDHIKWLDELDASVRERREFRLATDAHKCAFGRWYDSYRSTNQWIAAALRHFEKPHAEIHATAIRVREHQDRGEHDTALQVVTAARNGVLRSLMHLFDNLRALIKHSEQQIAIVLRADGREFAILVDEAAALEKLDPSTVGPLPLASSDGILTQVASHGKDSQLVLLVAAERLMPPGDIMVH